MRERQTASLLASGSATSDKWLSYVPNAGWGNQLFALANALFIATHLGRGIVRVGKSNRRCHPLSLAGCPVAARDRVTSLLCTQVLPAALHEDDTPLGIVTAICSGQTPNDFLLSNYASVVSKSPRVNIAAYLNVSALGVPTTTTVDSTTCTAPDCVTTDAHCMSPTDVTDKLIPMLKSGGNGTATLVRTGFSYSLPKPGALGWAKGGIPAVTGCSIKYRGDVVSRAKALLATKMGSAYDAAHVRVNLTKNWHAVLTPVLKSPADTPLYLMSDNLTGAPPLHSLRTAVLNVCACCASSTLHSADIRGNTRRDARPTDWRASVWPQRCSRSPSRSPSARSTRTRRLRTRIPPRSLRSRG